MQLQTVYISSGGYSLVCKGSNLSHLHERQEHQEPIREKKEEIQWPRPLSSTVHINPFHFLDCDIQTMQSRLTQLYITPI